MNLIAQLDDYCLQHDADRQLPGEFQTGPFGVFEVQGASSAAHPSERSVTEGTTAATASETSSAAESLAALSKDANVVGVIEPDSTVALFHNVPSDESSAEEIEINRQDDMFSAWGNLDTTPVRLSPQRDVWQLGDPFGHDFSIPMYMPGGDLMGLDFYDNMLDTSFGGRAAELFDQANVIFSLNLPAPQARSHADWAHLLTEAPQLLRYYQSASDAPEQAKQSFWKAFILPSAMRTFGEMSVFGKATDASSSIFYSTLANSAFAMQNPDAMDAHSSHWHTVGKSAEEAAQYYLQSALRCEESQLDGQELLSATLSMCLVSVSLLQNAVLITVP